MIRPFILCASLVLAFPCGADDAGASSSPARIDHGDDDFIYSQSFLSAHPDLYYRLRGTQARNDGDFAEARGYYRRAARYADKLAQAAYAEMLWNGEGGAADHVLGYAWMDLAAERANRFLLAKREAYWAAMSPEQHDQAIEQGQAVYAEFADDVAKPRLERELRRARNNITGSHLGAVGKLDVQVRNADGSFGEIKGERYYADRYWKPEQYWRWKNQSLDAAAAQGSSVRIGPIDALEQPRSDD